jgi:hypothetical protein
MVSDDYGFPEFANPEHRGNKDGPLTACKLVAEELGLGERWVEEIRRSHKTEETMARPPRRPQ